MLTIKVFILMRISFISAPEADERLDNKSKITHCISSQFDSTYSLIYLTHSYFENLKAD